MITITRDDADLIRALVHEVAGYKYRVADDYLREVSCGECGSRVRVQKHPDDVLHQRLQSLENRAEHLLRRFDAIGMPQYGHCVRCSGTDIWPTCTRCGTVDAARTPA